MAGNVTLKSIAAHLNVSQSTVARSLRGGKGLSPQTVELVRKTADEMGYVRNLDGLRLRTGNSLVIMALLRMSTDDDVGDTGSIGLLHGIHERLQATDYSVRAAPVFSGEKAIDQLKRVVAGRKADGVILDQIKADDERIQFLIEKQVPFVTFGRDDLCAQHAYFDLDNEKAAYDTTSGLIERGAHRIGAIEGQADFQYVKQRVAGYRQALKDNGIDFDPELVRHIKLEAPLAKSHAADLIAAHNVDAINCVNELTMFGAHAASRDHERNGGAPVMLGSVTSTNIGQYLGLSLLVSHFRRSDAGWALADALLKQIDGEPLSQSQRVAAMQLQHY